MKVKPTLIIGALLCIFGVYMLSTPMQGADFEIKEMRFKSEIRGVFIHEAIYGYNHDWNTIAETLSQYGINAVFVNDQGGLSQRPDSEIRAAINAFHAHGIEYHSCMAVLQETVPPEPLGTEAITYDGEVYSKFSHCPIKAHDHIIQHIKDYLSKFPDVDGIMLDYIRYADEAIVCYCEHCRAAFEEWLGEEITDWSQFYPNGPRYNEFLDWRNIPLTTLVKDIHDTIKSINPNIVISEAAWSLFDDTPIYWRKWLGQDTAKWIAEGYVDFVAPMMYTKEVTGEGVENLESYINAITKYWTGGDAKGPVPIVAFLRVDWRTEDLTPDQFKAEVEYVRSRGLGGWIIWRYGGPGTSEPNPDIRDYLSALPNEPYFEIYDLDVGVINDTTMAVTWKTTIPTTGTVEYSENPLFSSELRSVSGFNYWHISQSSSIQTVEDPNKASQHYIVLAGLTPHETYYFRVLSSGSGTAFTPQFTFVAGEGIQAEPPPTPPTEENQTSTNQTSPPPEEPPSFISPLPPSSAEGGEWMISDREITGVLMLVAGGGLIYVGVKKKRKD